MSDQPPARSPEEIAHYISDRYLDTDTFSVAINAGLYCEIKEILDQERAKIQELEKKLERMNNVASVIDKLIDECENQCCVNLVKAMYKALSEIKGEK